MPRELHSSHAILPCKRFGIYSFEDHILKVLCNMIYLSNVLIIWIQQSLRNNILIHLSKINTYTYIHVYIKSKLPSKIDAQILPCIFYHIIRFLYKCRKLKHLNEKFIKLYTCARQSCCK